MEESTLGLRHGDQEAIECWDDDGDLQCTDDFQFRTASTATSVTSSSVRRSGHRDSISSRRSARSDLDSNVGGDEDWQVLLQDNDEAIAEETIASVKSAGIPIPASVPKSALLGGTIKRLGRRKIKKAVVDDWSEDLELPGNDGELTLKTNEKIIFPDSLRQISSNLTSPVKSHTSALFDDADSSPKSKTMLSNLDKFRDSDDGADVENLSTIKLPRLQKPISLCSPQGINHDNENFEKDFELPADNAPLTLLTRKDFPRTSSPNADEFDIELFEGSIGVRFGGTTRDGRSNRSSSVSGISPSVSSCLTGESEDDGLDGLVLPDGPLNLEESLRKRQDARRTEVADHPKESLAAKRLSGKDDFFSDIEIGDGDVFNSAKLTLNQNIKRKMERPASPARRSSTTVTFTNKAAVSPKSRLPRLSGHDRAHSTHLEPVSESGAPLSKFQRSQTRICGHTSHSSLPSLPVSNTASTPLSPPTPNRRSLGRRSSREALRSEPTTTSAQFLRAKRSMPVIQGTSAPGSIPSLQRPPSRQEGTSRASARPKTPVDRTGDSRLNPKRRPQVPFLPAGASPNQSHHVSIVNLRHFRRNDSDSSSDMIGTQRSMSRLSGFNRPDSPGRRSSNELSPEALVAAAKRTITRPARRRNFGDGTELEAFDDLPTSASAESKFVKHPAGRGAPRSLRNRLSQSQVTPPSRSETLIPPSTPVNSSKPQDFTPRFARDTNASRNARQQRVTSATISVKEREGCPLAPVNANWRAQARSRGAGNSTTVGGKKTKTAGTPGARPHLIKPMGTGVHEAKSVKGMHYNPATFRWEGNENAVTEFDDVASPKSPKPAPALITNVGAIQGVQVVGGMVFDPQRMCWLKLAPSQPGKNGVAVIHDEDDVFAGLDDLQDRVPPTVGLRGGRTSGGVGEFDPATSGDERSAGESSDDWPITEEFDVGPEFIRRQRAEEEKWRRKVDKWITADRRKFGDDWRWAIRDLVRSDRALNSGQFGNT
ncbi:hypothetical protein VTN02DRAFT_5164 [Thermoascus thermophilus]